MIIGILILAIMGVMLYVSNTFITEEFAAEGQPIVDTVTQEFVAIQGYTETCLYSTAQNGLILLGQQGGYIYPTSLGDFSITNPTDSIGISIDPLLIPYWHYNSEYNGNPSVSLASLQPSLYDSDLDKDYAGGEYMSIEAQLGRYIEEEINDCLNEEGVAYITVRRDCRSLNGMTKRGTFQRKVNLPFEVMIKDTGFITYKMSKNELIKMKDYI